jgi:hypothetical protein
VDAHGATTVHATAHRETFRGLAKYRRWSPLDALYFFDYVAELIGAWARAAHFWEDSEEAEGLLVAKRRHAVAQLFGQPLLPFVALHAEFSSAEVRLAPPPIAARGTGAQGPSIDSAR